MESILAKKGILWLNSLRRIIKLGGSKILIISSGAQVATELRDERDIYKILNLVGLSECSCKKILENSKTLLRNAALKRYGSNNAISNPVNVDKLKSDFIVNYNKISD